ANTIGIVVATSGNASTINFNSSYTFNTASGAIYLQTRLPNSGDQPGSINLAPGITFTSGGPLQVNTPVLNLGANSSLVSSAASGPGITVLSSVNGPKPLTINLPTGSAATISTLGGSISFMPSSGNNVVATVVPAADQSVTFATSTGTGTATLHLNGGPVFIETAGAASATTSFNTGVTLVATGNLTATSAGNINVGGAITANNVTLQTTANNSNIV